MQRQTAITKLPATVRTVIDAAMDRKATDVVVLDLRRAHGFTDYFVICSGTNPRQIKAIADAIETALKAQKMRPNHIEGYERGEWVLIDCFDFIVHIFNLETRTFYALERLWGNADRIEVAAPEPPADTARR
ncbi:MAG TPA: ribosome silencing factor [Vicinamibacterales bacterium]|jgi:ribosome-associated protein